jgi:hypothetical protein
MGSRAIPPQPPDAEGLRLYQTLLQPLPTASADFARAYLPHLATWLSVKNPQVSADLCEEAAVEAVYSLLRQPQCYSPTKGQTLIAYLRRSARCDLLNVLERERRHAHQPLEENVELTRAGRKEGREPWQILCEREDGDARERLLQAVRSTLAEPERQALALLLAGERRTAAFADALGLQGLPAAEQEAAVKRAKDRIKKRIERWRDGR